MSQINSGAFNVPQINGDNRHYLSFSRVCALGLQRIFRIGLVKRIAASPSSQALKMFYWEFSALAASVAMQTGLAVLTHAREFIARATSSVKASRAIRKTVLAPAISLAGIVSRCWVRTERAAFLGLRVIAIVASLRTVSVMPVSRVVVVRE
jgi:hypothetical protein